MADPKYAVDDCRRKLVALDAQMFEGLEDAEPCLLGDGEIHVSWKVSDPALIPPLRWFLEQYTWVTNTNPAKTITDPKIKNKVINGLWRQAYIRDLKRTERDGEMYYLILTLRKGYITTLVTGSNLDWSEARLADGTDFPGGTETTAFTTCAHTGATTASNFVMVQWPNVSPYDVYTVCGQLKALDKDTWVPTIKGKSYGTNFHQLNVAHSLENDGSATIKVLLAKPEFKLTGVQLMSTHKQSDVTYHWDVPRSLAQALIDSETGAGKSIVPSYNPTQGLVDIVVYTRKTTGGKLTGVTISSSCDADVYADLYWGISDPSGYTCPTYAAGHTYFKDVDTAGDGTYDVTIRTKKTRYRNYSLRESVDSVLMQRWEHLQKGVTTETVDTMPPTGSPVQGYIYRQDRTANDDCSSDYNTVIDKGIYADVPNKRIVDSFFQYDYEEIVRNDTVPSDTPDAVPGSIYTASNTINEYGLYDKSIRTRNAKYLSLSTQTTGDSAFESDYQAQQLNAAAPAGSSAHTQGLIYNAQDTPNEFGLYDSVQRARKAKKVELGTEKIVDSMFEAQYQRTVRNDTSPVACDTFTPGYVYTADLSYNEFGCYDGLKRTRAAVYGTVPYKRLLDSGVESDYERIFRNDTAPIDASENAVGYTYSADNAINEFGLYDSRERYRLSKSVGVYKTFQTRYGEGWFYRFRNNLWGTVNTYIGYVPIYGSNQINVNPEDDLTYSGLIEHRPGPDSATVFVGASADWYEYSQDHRNARNSPGDTETRQVYWYRHSAFYAVRQNAANAMSGKYRCSGPDWQSGLWESEWADAPIFGDWETD